MKVKYLGTGRGQGDEIKIGGFRFVRDQSINIPAKEVERLGLDRAGFEVLADRAAKGKQGADNAAKGDNK